MKETYSGFFVYVLWLGYLVLDERRQKKKGVGREHILPKVSKTLTMELLQPNFWNSNLARMKWFSWALNNCIYFAVCYRWGQSVPRNVLRGLGDVVGHLIVFKIHNRENLEMPSSNHLPWLSLLNLVFSFNFQNSPRVFGSYPSVEGSVMRVS